MSQLEQVAGWAAPLLVLEQNPVQALLEYSDELEEMVTICSCGKKAKFNARLINNEYTIEGQEVAIDGIDASYESLCGECYLKKVLKIDKIK